MGFYERLVNFFKNKESEPEIKEELEKNESEADEASVNIYYCKICLMEFLTRKQGNYHVNHEHHETIKEERKKRLSNGNNHYPNAREWIEVKTT